MKYFRTHSIKLNHINKGIEQVQIIYTSNREKILLFKRGNKKNKSSPNGVSLTNISRKLHIKLLVYRYFMRIQ